MSHNEVFKSVTRYKTNWATVRLCWECSLQSVHKSSITHGFISRPDRVVHSLLPITGAGWLAVGPWLIVGSDSAPIVTVTILRGCWGLRFITISTGFFICILRLSLISISGACSGDTHFHLWCAQCWTSGCCVDSELWRTSSSPTLFERELLHRLQGVSAL